VFKIIIVSQDKYNILNFDNTVNIGVEEITTLSDIVQISAQTNGNTVILGKYKTEKRAKEVLQEIIKKYTSYLELRGGPAIMQGQMDIQPNIFNIPKVHEMPEE